MKRTLTEIVVDYTRRTRNVTKNYSVVVPADDMRTILNALQRATLAQRPRIGGEEFIGEDAPNNVTRLSDQKRFEDEEQPPKGAA